MFKNMNKNWLKVLVPEAVVVVVTLAVFFLGRSIFGLEDKTAIIFALLTAMAISVAVVGIAILTFFTVFFALVTNVPVTMTMSLYRIDSNVRDTSYAFLASTTIAMFSLAVAFCVAFILTAVVGVVAMVIAVAVADRYKLPKARVILSYLAEALVIFLPLYFTVN